MDITVGGLSIGRLEESIAAAARGAPIAGIGFASYDPAADTANAGPSVVRRLVAGVLEGLAAEPAQKGADS
ncbi:MAG: hypothetical protein ACE5GX_01715 [Thermoanaerobaculia bacterium]